MTLRAEGDDDDGAVVVTEMATTASATASSSLLGSKRIVLGPTVMTSRVMGGLASAVVMSWVLLRG
jgi:hypothetical protein